MTVDPHRRLFSSALGIGALAALAPGPAQAQAPPTPENLEHELPSPRRAPGGGATSLSCPPPRPAA